MRRREKEPTGPTPAGDHHFTVLPAHRGHRLDEFLSLRIRGYGKHVVRRWIGHGQVKVNGEAVSPTLFLKAWDEIDVKIPKGETPNQVPKYLPIQIIHEDERILVVNKSPGIAVLPGRSPKERVALFEGLLYYLGSEVLPTTEEDDAGEAASEEESPAASGEEPAEPGETPAAPGDAPSAPGGAPPLPKPRLAHRLDKDTSGVMVVAKDYDALVSLTKQFEERTVRKEYVAIVRGEIMPDQGVIEFRIAAHRKDPNRWVVSKKGREAVTEFETLERFDGFSLVLARPRTGRTHQIRVHMRAIGHPLAVDPVYADKSKIFLSELKSEYKKKRGVQERPVIDRLTLHARKLTVRHPGTGAEVSYEAPLPDDMEFLLKALRKYRPRQPAPAPEEPL